MGGRNRAKVMGIAFFILLLVMLPSVYATSSTVTRSLSSLVVGEDEVLTVTLNVTIDGNYNETYYAIDDVIPENFTVVSAGTGSMTSAGHIRWAVVEDANSTLLSYSVRCNVTGNYAFSGVYMFENMTNDAIIGGDSAVEVTGSLGVYNVSLFNGWNLISTPLEPVNASIGAVLGNLTRPVRVFAYNASLPELERWSYYSSEALHPSMNSLNEMNAGRAYWLHTSVNETLTVTGMLPEPKDISIYSGWNFVGYNWGAMNTSVAVSQLTAPTRIFAYNASLSVLERWTYSSSEALHPGMNSLNVMSVGRGYWLHSEDNETWSVV